jgi:hypothetical protein
LRGFFCAKICHAVSIGICRFPERSRAPVRFIPRLSELILSELMEHVMRNVLFAASAIVALAVPGAASAQYYYGAADVYAPPPPAAYVAPPATYVAPAPMAQSQVYLAPGTPYVAPGAVYDDQQVIINGQRYFKDCWWDWGRRRCEYKSWPQ